MTFSSPSAGPLLVDAHVHVFTRDMPLVPNPRHTPGYSFTVEQLLETMDAHGVQFAVIAAASPWGDYNDYVIESLRKSPRLRGTVIVDPGIERLILEDMHAAGVRGVRLPFISMRELPDLDSWNYRKFLRRLADLDWHVHLHIEGPRIPEVLPALEASGVKIVIDHIGRPGPEDSWRGAGFQAMIRSVQSGRAWVKMSGAYRLGSHARECAQVLCKEAGTDRLMWASDCPFVGAESTMSYQAAIDWLADTVPDPDARRRIFADNALRFYFS
ncbi:2-pyrone-4,6-dicarbaxylate hydrolase [Pigmentiphaga humi]|uniref:2-pyrone-4,6-dicarbaxylate hydrolase n=1 Tax=Pigmentiphaga humi TaxID=2478468 RepID=A0A3P4AX70_9BURK|nr:amidohydrolase family protein [Pigmentiphaga humi]VCU68048.1 2-pyrone-4,6-dicarbaxylate hydrolase [Pigmentiphaga humi]